MMDDKALEEKAFEFCEKSGCLHGASLATLLREVAEEARREVLEQVAEGVEALRVAELVATRRGEGEK